MRSFLSLMLVFLGAGLLAQEVFKHDLTGEKKPWTHEKFLNKPENFKFIIIPDRAGAERKGIFPEAIRKANLLQPEFIMTVGDLINGQMNIKHQDHEHLREQWRELRKFTEASEAPFFYVVGNHDICRTRKGFPRSNETSREVWEENLGKNTYYYFIYKNVLFICLNTMEGADSRVPQESLTESQVEWAKNVIAANKNVRWTFVFMHHPGVFQSNIFGKIEKALSDRKYTVFAGDWHHYLKFQRHGRNYYALATAGGGSKMRGVEYGEFDHITQVTVTDNGPVVVNLLLDGILNEDVVTPYNTKHTIRRNLDLPIRKEAGTAKKEAKTEAGK